jgi:quinol-cytochrome oxidoreductase complex cytochrome b subunit
MHKADQDYIDAYFLQRRAKEIRRMLIAVFALIAGGLCAGLAEPIVGFLNESPSLSISQSAVSTFGLVINLCGFAILSIWIMDGKDYVFPPKHRKGSEGQE